MGKTLSKTKYRAKGCLRIALSLGASVLLSSATRHREPTRTTPQVVRSVVSMAGSKKSEAVAYLEGLVRATVDSELIAMTVPTDTVAVALQVDFDDARFARDLATHRERAIRAAQEHKDILRDESREFMSEIASQRPSRTRVDRLPSVTKTGMTSHSSSSGVRFGKLNIDLAFNKGTDIPAGDSSSSTQSSSPSQKSSDAAPRDTRPVTVAVQVPDTRSIELEEFNYEAIDYIRKLRVNVALPAITPFGSEGYIAVKIRRHPELNRYFEGEAAQGIYVVRLSGSIADEMISLLGSPRGARGIALVVLIAALAGGGIWLILRRRKSRVSDDDTSLPSRSMASLYTIPEPVVIPSSHPAPPPQAVAESQELDRNDLLDNSKEGGESSISVAKMAGMLGKADAKDGKPGSLVYRRLILRLVATAELDDEAEIMALVPPQDVALRRAMLKTRVFLKDVKFVNRRLLATALESVGSDKAAEFAVVCDPETRAALREALMAMLGKDALARDIETRFGQIINDPGRLETVRRNRKIVALRVLDFLTQALKSDEQQVEEIIARQAAALNPAAYKTTHKAS
jgi:hypothetical protein